MLSAAGFGLLPITETDQDVLAKFDCGKEHLNKFLSDNALELHQARLSYTNVVFHEDVAGCPVGYFTVCNDAIRLKASEQMDIASAVDLSAFPAVKLCRLAMQANLQGQGNGRQVMDLIVGQIVSESSFSAARLLVVDAENVEDVIRFYARYGFLESLWAADQAKNQSKRNAKPAAVKMWLDILTFGQGQVVPD